MGIQYIQKTTWTDETPSTPSWSDETPTALPVFDECQWKEMTFTDSGQVAGDDTGDEILEKETYPD